jgi:hypothetical protein
MGDRPNHDDQLGHRWEWLERDDQDHDPDRNPHPRREQKPHLDSFQQLPFRAAKTPLTVFGALWT